MTTGATLFYSISSATLSSSPPGLPRRAGVPLNVVVDGKASEAGAVFNALARRNEAFIVSLSPSVVYNREALDQWLPALYLLTGCYGYHFAGSPVIPLLATPDSGTAETSIALREYFRGQGTGTVHLPVIDAASAGNVYITGSTMVVFEDLAAALHDMPATDLSTPAGNGRCLNNPDGSEVLLWRRRTLLYREFLELSKRVQQQEYYEVLDWYNHEYEILPKWYKQFGHILKVLMGKRTIKSLFSDKVKKYRD